MCKSRKDQLLDDSVVPGYSVNGGRQTDQPLLVSKFPPLHHLRLRLPQADTEVHRRRHTQPHRADTDHRFCRMSTSSTRAAHVSKELLVQRDRLAHRARMAPMASLVLTARTDKMGRFFLLHQPKRHVFNAQLVPLVHLVTKEQRDPKDLKESLESLECLEHRALEDHQDHEEGQEMEANSGQKVPKVMLVSYSTRKDHQAVLGRRDPKGHKVRLVRPVQTEILDNKGLLEIKAILEISERMVFQDSRVKQALLVLVAHRATVRTVRQHVRHLVIVRRPKELLSNPIYSFIGIGDSYFSQPLRLAELSVYIQ